MRQRVKETRKETWNMAEKYFDELIKKVFKSIFEEEKNG